MKATFFPDLSGSTVDRFEGSWDELVKRLKALPPAAYKKAAPLVSLCEYGDKVSDKGSIRTAENVIACYGVELDYDGETMPPQEAADRLFAAGVKCFVYTTATHTAATPRWRVIMPCERPISLSERRIAAERVNGLLDGKLSNESFSESQAFFCGPVAGIEYKSWTLNEGASTLDRVDLPCVGWRGRTKDEAGGSFVPDDVFVENVLAGDEVWPSLRDLGWRGWTEEDLRDIVERSTIRTTRPERYAQALIDCGRAVKSANEKKQRQMEKRMSSMPVPPRPVQEYSPPPEPRMPATEGPALVHVSELIKNIRPADWLIRRVFERGHVVVLFGDSQGGKSFASVDWSACIATGRPWNGRKTKVSSVIYFAGEGHVGIRKRFTAWQIASGVTLGPSVPLHVSDRTVELQGEQCEVYKELDRLGEQGRNGLIVFDTLGSLAPALDQKDSTAVNGFFVWCKKLARAYNCAVLVVHHSGLTEKRRPKGSSDFINASDTVIGIINPVIDDPRNPERVIFCTKQKDVELFHDMHFRFRSVELPTQEEDDAGKMVFETSAIFEAFKPAASDVQNQPPPPLGAPAETLMDILRQGPDEGVVYGELQATWGRLRGVRPARLDGQFGKLFDELKEKTLIVHDADTGMVRIRFS